ncbi:chitosanase [Symbioplanes lichenis]|uniref:chitosanase n=1 Tax=Symbioplanes lichenis TaxID=1629072 RepID=UPI0027391F04|nr:chitosanase [Actinoplanes lichenis]
MGIRAKSVALVVGVAAVCMVPLVISVTADAAPDLLLTRDRPVLASSTKTAGVAGRFAVDGDMTTTWLSGSPAGSQWLRVDLGRSQRITRVRVGWGPEFARSYAVQVSDDGASWTDLYRTGGGDGGTDDLKKLSGAGRYLRVLGTQRDGTGYALRDLRAYGPGPVAPATESAPGTSLAVPAAAAGLAQAAKKELAFKLVSSAENSTVAWRKQFGYIEDIGDGRGYTAGIVGFCSGTSDMLAVVTEYTRRKPKNVLARYLPALRTVDGSDSHAGLSGYPAAWRTAAADPVFQKTQEDERDRMYFDPAVTMASTDGVRALGQFAYYDAAVMHGVSGLRGIRSAALRKAKPPKQGGDEIKWLSAFLDARVAEMKKEEAHSDVSRVTTAQRVFLKAGNLDLNTPLSWRVYGDLFRA